MLIKNVTKRLYGEYLREERKKKGKTLGDLARTLKVSVTSVSDIERAKQFPFSDTQNESIARFLQIPVEELNIRAAESLGAFTLADYNVLLVWVTSENSPTLCLIKNPTKKDIELLEKAHRHYVNIDEEDDIQEVLIIADYICENADYWSNKNDPNNGKWVNCKLDTSSPIIIDVPISIICTCGWVD
jgi:transcriptional regulator with XRE-family HTH domain